jgi:hypothetical protein
LNVYDRNNPNPVAYSVTSSTVTRTGAATITYASISSLSLDGGKGGDSYNIESTAKGTALSVQGASGNDKFNISPIAQDLDHILGSVTIEDMILNNNTLNVYDNKNPNAVT